MAEEKIDIEITPQVDTTQLDDLESRLADLQPKADEASNSMDNLGNSTQSVDSGGVKQTASDTKDVKNSADNAVTSFGELQNAITSLAGFAALMELANFVDNVASSADNAELSIASFNAAFTQNVDGGAYDAMSGSITNLANTTALGKGEIRSLWETFGRGGIKSEEQLNSLSRSINALSGGSAEAFQSMASGLKRAFQMDSPQRAFISTMGMGLDQVASKLGMTEEAFKEMWKAATPEQRVDIFNQVASQVTDVEGMNKKIAQSYMVLKQNIDDAFGKMSTVIGEAILPVLAPIVQGIAEFVSMIADAFNSLPDGAKFYIVAGAIAAVGIVILGTLIPAVIALAGSLGLLSMNPITLLLVAIALAIIGIVAAVEQFGEMMGWWTDFGTMIEAIKAGVMRLWEAFINNEHVQAVITWLQEAWQGVLDFLQPIFTFITDMWNNIFPPQEGGFDIVGGIIALFGWLGDSIALVVGYIQANWPLVSFILSIILTPLYMIIAVLGYVRNNFGTVVGYFQTGAGQIVGAINTLISGWNSFASSVMSAYDTYIAPVIKWVEDGINKLKEMLGLQSQANAAGGAAGGLTAAGGLLSGTELSNISYPEQKYYEININGLVTEQGMIDQLLNWIEKGNEQENMRT